MIGKKALLSGIKELDKLARLYVLEGVLETTPGSLIRNMRNGFLSVQEKYPTLNPSWFDQKESGIIRAALKGWESIAEKSGKNQEDYLMEALAFPRSKKKDENSLYYIGQTNAEDIISGKYGPLQIGRMFSIFLKRKALTQVHLQRRFITEGDSIEEGKSQVPKSEIPSKFYDKSSLLVSLMSDPSNPLTSKLFDAIDQVIEEYPFEEVEEDPEISSSLLSFLRAFTKKNPRLESSQLKVQALAYLGSHPSPKNQKIIGELQDMDEDIVEEVATQSGGSKSDLRREAYKTWVQVVRDFNASGLYTSSKVTEFRKDPNVFWGKQFQKVNARVGQLLGYKPNDATMTRLLGVGGRNIMTFIQKIVAKDSRVQKIIGEMEVALAGDYSKSPLSRSAKLKKQILKVAGSKHFWKLLRS